MHDGYNLAEWLSLFGVKLASVVAGFVGATVAVAVRPKVSVGALVFSVLGGLATAAYIGPLVSYYLSLPSQFDGAVGFVLGVGGLVLAAGVVEVTRAMPRIAITTMERLSERWTGGGK